jgi:RHS repeat-associated protein
MRESSGLASGLSGNPSGGGGISSLGDRFQPDLVKGTGNYSVPINLPKGPNETSLNISLTYSTGAGNGVFGMGWRLDTLRIERRCDRGIPAYNAQDDFVLGDGVVLVKTGDGIYRPKSDNLFWKIQFKNNSWEILTGDGRKILLGQTDASREGSSKGVLAWYVDASIDQAGNAVNYSYLRNGNRLYLSSIDYSIFSLKIIYENRPDTLRNGRAGFLRTTAWRAKSLEVHCSRSAPTLMRFYQITYTEAQNSTSLLTGVLLTATKDGETASFPPLHFEYTQMDLNQWNIHELEAKVPPPSLTDKSTQFVDLNGDGLPDILQTVSSRTYAWYNNGKGGFEGPFAMKDIPSLIDLSRNNVAFADLNGDGRVDLFATDQPLKMMFSNNGKGGFDKKPVIFRSSPHLKLSSPANRLMDIDGDGVTDLLETGRTHFLLYKHEKDKGWKDPIAVSRLHDMENFPDLMLGTKGVYLEDMKGDGLQDLVWFQSGQLRYWPYIGNGQWGAAVDMLRAPLLPNGFRYERLVLTDIDGDGCTDVVYFDHQKTIIWINRSGNEFAPPVEIPFSPAGDFAVQPADVFGDGRPGFIWSGNKQSINSSGYRFLQLSKGKKPYLLKKIDNGMGGFYEMEFTTSAHMRTRDMENNRPWLFQLPFAIHVVNKIIHTDTVAGRSIAQEIQYHDGVFDGWQRDFRGFTHVEFTMSGDESSPGTRQELTFFHGDPDHPDLVTRERQKILAGSLLTTKIIELLPGSERLREESEQSWDTILLETVDGEDIFFPFLSNIETKEHSIGIEPKRIERVRYSNFDNYGNPGKRVRESFAEGQPQNEWIISEERFTYINDTVKWLVKLPVRSETYINNGLLSGAQVRYYDGPAFIGLAEGAATHGITTRVADFKLSPSRMPAGYAAGRDFAVMGYHTITVNGEDAWFINTMAVKRDSKGNIIEQKDNFDQAARIVYDADGLYPVSSFDVKGNATQFVFNPSSGEPQQTLFPDGRRVRNEYDAIGRLIASYELADDGVEELVKCWRTDIDKLPVSMISIAPKRKGFNAAALRNAADISAINGISVCKSIFDGFGTQIGEITSGPVVSGKKKFVLSKRSLLNAKGSAAIQYGNIFMDDMNFIPPGIPSDGDTRYFYDYKGNTISTAGPGASHFKVIKDNFHIAFFDGAGAGEVGLDKPTAGLPTRIEYFDAKSRLIKVEERDGNNIAAVNSFILSPDGLLLQVKDNNDQVFLNYDYAGPENPLKVTHRDVGSRIYYRDAGNRLVERISPDGSIHLYLYDDFGRMTRNDYKKKAGSPSETLRTIFYDDDPNESGVGRFLTGRIAVVNEAGNIIRYSYNRNGKRTEEKFTTDGVTLSNKWEFNIQGETEAVVYPDGKKVEYVIEDCGSVKEVKGYATNFLYNADGVLLSYDLANGMKVNIEKDTITQRINTISATHGANTLRRVSYGYDITGNITSMLDEMPGAPAEWHDYTYDALHRLTGDVLKHNNSAGSVLHTSSYQYDSSGNLLQFNDLQTQAMHYADAVKPGRLTSASHGSVSKPVTYDNNGNIRSFGDLQDIKYNAFDRVSQVQMPDKMVSLSYDHNGRRILKQVVKGGVIRTTRFAAGLYEINGSNAVRNIFLDKHILASDKISLAVPATTSTAYYLADHHGTILLAADEAGNILANQRYSAFGSNINTSMALDKYLGRDRDSETALLQLGARYYASFLGRFISPDWYVIENPGKAMRIPQALNIYSYAANNPLVFKDPSGMFLFFAIGVIMAIIYVAAIATAVAFGVGFIAGLIYGLATGKGWESLLRGLEAGLTTMVGMWLGAVTGMLVGGLFGGLPGMLVGGIIGGVIGGLNGLVSGMTGIYDWSSWKGWAAFLSDSTWGLVGTALGLVVHTINIGWGKYRGDLSERQNRHVYESGVRLKDTFAFTMGNVISNAGQGGSTVNVSFIANHEELHVWQSRMFGPIFQATYIVWAVVGFFVALFYWFSDTSKDLGSLIETAAYYDNPFEYWAYKNDSNWPPGGSNPDLRWS